jgi:uncharacterized membrane protein
MKADVNRLVGFALTSGVVLSLVILAFGSILFLMHPVPQAAPGSIPNILRGVARLDPVATINLGLLVLILTPVLRIIAALIAFAMERNLRYVIISVTVLTILAVSALTGNAK